MNALLFLLAFLMTAVTLFPQASDANLTGVVTDSSGASISGASVTLEDTSRGYKYSAKTGEDGTYRFHNLLPGNWNLTVEHTGFARSVLSNIRLDANRTGTVNVTLEVSAVTTSVEVRESPAVIDTTTATVQNTYTTQQALRMPITGLGTGPSNLGVINLSLLSAGVTSGGSVGYGTGPSVGGQRPTNNNFMIDGMDNNVRSTTGPSTTVSNEAVAEFSLQQNQFSTEFGHSTGGQFNTIIKSGTNALHGSLYEYFQHKSIGAIDESFARQGIREAPRFDHNRFGGTIGGPVVKNRWFYFGNYERTAFGGDSTTAGAVYAPTAEGFRILSGLPGVSRQNFENFRRFVPDAAEGIDSITAGGVEIPVGIINVTGPSFNNFDHYVVSSDYNLSERDQIRARYIYNNSNTLSTGSVSLPEFFTPVNVSNHFASLSHYHTFTPTLTNELRMGYLRSESDRPVGDQVWQGLDAFPNIQFLDLGLRIGPNPNFPQSTRNNTFQLMENITWQKGRHTLKFGYDGRKLNNSTSFVTRARGFYSYNTLDRFLRDITPETGERSVGGFPFIGNNLSHYVFASDEWRLRPNLTVTFGLRYEHVGVPTGSKQQAVNAVSSVPGLIEFREPKASTRDFAPRLGVAWSPGRSGLTSIRAGFGMSYDQFYQNLGAITLPPQFFTTVQAHFDRPNQPNFLANGGITGEPRPVTDPATARRLTAAYVADQVRPYSIVWNVGVQRVLRRDYTVEVRYLGSRGVHLPIQAYLNRPASVTAERSLPLYYQRPTQAELDSLTLTRGNMQAGAVNDPLTLAGFGSPMLAFLPRGNSTYHGLAIQVNKRFSQGLQFVASYTWSHNIDDSTATLNSTVTSPRRPQDFHNLRAERASSALDRRHRFTVGWLYETPWLRNSRTWALKNLVGNWFLGGTYMAETGAWATASSGFDANLNGDTAGDRTVINPAGDAGRGSDTTALTNSSGATVAYLVNDPTARYIRAREGVYANGGRNTIRMPAINNFDLTAGKRVQATERIRVEFRAEFYNALNHPQFTPGVPNTANFRSRTGAADSSMLTPGTPTFLRPDLAFESNSRLGQLVLRLEF